MNSLFSIGRWLFAIPFALLASLYLVKTTELAPLATPAFVPPNVVWVYMVVAVLLGAATTMMLGRYDRFGALVLAVYLLALALLVHVPRAIDWSQTATALSNLLKDLSLAGAALLYARHYAVDPRLPGRNNPPAPAVMTES